MHSPYLFIVPGIHFHLMGFFYHVSQVKVGKQHLFMAFFKKEVVFLTSDNYEQ